MLSLQVELYVTTYLVEACLHPHQTPQIRLSHIPRSPKSLNVKRCQCQKQGQEMFKLTFEENQLTCGSKGSRVRDYFYNFHLVLAQVDKHS